MGQSISTGEMLSLKSEKILHVEKMKTTEENQNLLLVRDIEYELKSQNYGSEHATYLSYN